MHFSGHFGISRHLHWLVSLVFPDPEIKGYGGARKQFVKTCRALASERRRMRLFILSGEQSIQPSRETAEVLEGCFEHIDELIIGGGPGIAIERSRVERMEPAGSSIFQLRGLGFDLSSNEEILDYYEIGNESPEEAHPYIQLCRKFQKRHPDRAAACKYILQEMSPEGPTLLSRRHLAIIEVDTVVGDRDSGPCFPLVVIEDLHLPFRPRQAAVFRYLTPIDDDFKKIAGLKNRFMKAGREHDLSKPPPCRLVDPST